MHFSERDFPKECYRLSGLVLEKIFFNWPNKNHLWRP